jgi:hypothetical protein
MTAKDKLFRNCEVIHRKLKNLKVMVEETSKEGIR